MHVAASRAQNTRKTWIIIILFILFISTIGFVVGKLFDLGFQGGLCAFTIACIYTGVMYFHADFVIIRAVRARKIHRENNVHLYQKAQELASSAAIPTPALYFVDTTTINSFSLGRTPRQGKIIVTSGLVDHLTTPEVEAVLAHEIAHITSHETTVSSLTTLIPGFFSFWGEFFKRKGGILRSLSWILLIFSPISALFMHIVLSPKREFEADAAAVLLTKYPTALANALEKTQHNHHAVPTAYAATAHLFFVHPFTTNTTPFLATVMSVHPPRTERIKILQSM